MVMQWHVMEVWSFVLRTLDGGGRRGCKDGLSMPPMCRPLLRSLSVGVNLIDLPVRVHTSIIAAHGSLALVPSGEMTLLAAGASGAVALQELRSEFFDHQLTLFLPYLQRLSDMVSTQGARVSPVLRPEVSQWLLPLLLVKNPGIQSRELKDLLERSCKDWGSGEGGEGNRGDTGGGGNQSENRDGEVFDEQQGEGGVAWLISRLPRECINAMWGSGIQTILGALGTMGPHLGFRIWGKLLKAVGILAPRSLLPLNHSGSKKVEVHKGCLPDRYGTVCSSAGRELTIRIEMEEGEVKEEEVKVRGEQGVDGNVAGDSTNSICSEEKTEGKAEEENRLWVSLEAFWEFAFLVVIPEALSVHSEESLKVMEEALSPLFGTLKRVWPLLTGPLPSCHRPSLVSAFRRSEALWLAPLLDWVTTTWLPAAIRRDAALFVTESLLPTLAQNHHPVSANASSSNSHIHSNADANAKCIANSVIDSGPLPAQHGAHTSYSSNPFLDPIPLPPSLPPQSPPKRRGGLVNNGLASDDLLSIIGAGGAQGGAETGNRGQRPFPWLKNSQQPPPNQHQQGGQGLIAWQGEVERRGEGKVEEEGILYDLHRAAEKVLTTRHGSSKDGGGAARIIKSGGKSGLVVEATAAQGWPTRLKNQKSTRMVPPGGFRRQADLTRWLGDDNKGGGDRNG
ncbi:unnamed protein product, partial [Choristocarpus tenellus]